MEPRTDMTPPRRIPGRSFLTWTLAYGITRTALKAAARRGDLIARLDLDPDLREDPFSAYEDLRGRGPIVPGRLVHASVDHASITEILRSDRFGVGGGHEELPGALGRLHAKIADPQTLGPVEQPSMLAMDPPEHTRYRRLVTRAFTARVVAGLESRIEEIASGLLDDLAHSTADAVDLVETYASLLPVAVIADMLGVPAHMRTKILHWANGAAATLDPALSWRDYRGAEQNLRRLHGWFADHVEELRRHPGEDLLSQLTLLQGEDELTQVELHAVGLLVLGAGFETTVNLIGNAVWQFSRHPEQLDVLRGRPDLWANAADEVLRYDSPVQLTLRMAHHDTTVAGTEIPAGTPVLLFLGGANRDPAVFDDPHRFDVARANAGAHLAFSSGVHYCLGASLARREAEVGLRLLYERFPDLDVVGPPTRRPTRVLRGYERLPVRLGQVTPRIGGTAPITGSSPLG